MPNIYTIAAAGASFNTEKCMLGVFNGSGSSKIIRIYKIVMLNSQTQAVTGGVVLMRLDRFSTGSGGIDLIPVKHDSSSSLLPASIVISTNMSFTKDATMQQFLWSTDEPTSATVENIDEFQVTPLFGTVFDATLSYTNTTFEPIVLREGYGFGVVCQSAYTTAFVATAATGIADLFMEITVEDT